MTRFRLPLLLSCLVLAAPPAQAQGFFERLFGLAPERPAAPPAGYPAPPGPGESVPSEAPRYTPPPVLARPVALRVPTEDGVVGRELKQNGSAGSLRIERTGRSDLRARITLAGRKSAQSVESCSISLGGQNGLALEPLGRPEGTQRFQVTDPASPCALQLDILDEAVLVKPKGDGSCLIQAPACQADAAGMWGPEPGQLIPRARDHETARGSADKAVRENYKVLVQRARPESVRPIVSEQAGFSSEREMLCRTYAREPMHSFCNARFSEARAIALAQRLGVTVASVQVTSPAPSQAEVRTRRRADPYALPAIEDLVRNPFDD